MNPPTVLTTLQTFLLTLSLLYPRQTTAANITSLTGVWTSKSWAVFTGHDSYNTVSDRLIEPKLTGSSYSFTDDGFFEEAIYITISNPTEPSCPKALLQYQHGTYTLPPNGSLVLHPIAADGRQLLSDPCIFKKAVYAKFNVTEVFKQWEVVEDEYRALLGQANPYRLNLWRWDGTSANPLYRVDSKPRMNPITSEAGVNGNAGEIKKTVHGSSTGSRAMKRTVGREGKKMGEVDADPGGNVGIQWALGPGMLFVGVVGLLFP
ncbi:chaperone for protein-folding within the ER, fungal-domain-containing protein [Tirmania nivea]|nr:chaperone for protein-folding within the ER, fungal-domain-containing protein [Tirmania nivea]